MMLNAQSGFFTKSRFLAMVAQTDKFLRLIKLFLWVLLGLYGYSFIMDIKGGFSSAFLYQQWLEMLFLFYIYGLFYVVLKPVKSRPVLAAIPIFLIYIVHDIFYLVYGKVFRFINVLEVSELLQVLPLAVDIVLVLLVAMIILLIVSRINYQKPFTVALALAPLLIIIGTIKASPDVYANTFESFSHEIVKYSDGKSVENNGRLAMLLYREAQRSATLDSLGPYRNRENYDQFVSKRIESIQQHIVPQNVHLIVLESFLDPRLFNELKFSQPPVHPDFEKFFTDKLGLSISPVFGGATAQAEFEVLCGVPAFEKLSSVEFNVFTGSHAHCLPGMLSAMNYRTIASNAYKPNFFNAIPGYQGTGFKELQFPVEFYSGAESYLHFGDPGVEEYIFDKSLFEQNIEMIKNHLQQENTRPIFNYMMTIYGHTPHILDPEARPEIIQTQSDYADDHLQRAANQFYYRTQAIAEYVKKLMLLDKNSMIILMSDHVPPLRNGPNTFKALRYLNNSEQSIFYNRIAIIENGQAVKYAPIHHYEVADVVLNYLTKGHHCQAESCAHLGKKTATRDERLPAYLSLMAHASE